MRVLRYVAAMLELTFNIPTENADATTERRDSVEAAVVVPDVQNQSHTEGDIEGISPVALKWMKRSGLEPKGLQKLFSLGIDEIDLVAKDVPGKKTKERMHSVLLLKGIAAYLGTGVARVTHEQLKEACLHYNAYDGSNFASYMKTFASEVGGAKEGGYTLSARGLTAGTDLVRGLLTTKA